MLHVLFQTTQPTIGSGFSLQNVIALIAAITALLVALPAALYALIAASRAFRAEVAASAAQAKAMVAQAVGDVNSQRITNTSAHVARVDGQQTELAQKVGEVTGAATATATALLAQQQQQQP